MKTDDHPEQDSQRLISVIIRTKDRPQLLNNAIASVVAQDHKPIELVVVNDGGSDITDIVAGHREHFFAVQSFALASSGGRSQAANQGLEIATGEFVLLLDDDDWLAPEHLSSLLQLLEAQQATVVAAYSSTQCIDTRSNQTVRLYDQPYDATRLKVENYIPLHAVLFKRSAIDTPPCRFDTSLDLYEDWDFWLQLSSQGEFIHSGLMTAFYRINENSGEGVSADQSKAMLALDQITHKWVGKLTAKDYRELIGRARFLQNKVNEISLKQTELEKAAHLDRVVQHCSDQYEREIARLTAAHKEEKQSLSDRYEQEIQRLSTGSENQQVLMAKQTREQISALTSQHERDIESLASSHTEEKESLRQQHESDIQTLIKQHQQERYELNALYQDQLNTGSRLANENKTLKTDIGTISNNYENEIARLSADYQQILTSNSWQLTRPVRFLRRLLTGQAGDPVQAIKKQLLALALFLYRLPVTSRLIRRLPFTVKQRIRNLLSPQVLRSDDCGQEAMSAKDQASQRVSIIIPVYNHAEYLQTCIDSALQQSWPETEVLICDDASPDARVKSILKKYENAARCRVLYSTHNDGICRTQNKLLAAATGNIIAFLDCDDYLAPDAIERCMQYWQEDTIYLHTGRINVDSRGNEVSRISFEHLPRKNYFEENLERMYATHLKLIHRGAIARVGAFDTRFDSAQDYDLLMRIAFHYPSDCFVHVPDFLYFHRFHEQQTTELMNGNQQQATDTIQAEARLRKTIRAGEFSHFLSFIMLSYGKKNQTLEALKSLARTVKVPHEIILFDNGSEADTVAYIKEEIEGKFDHLKVHYNATNLGPAAGRRAALEHASGDWFIVFDNDEIAEEGWLEELLVRASSDPGIGAVCCKVIFPDNSLQFSGGFLRHEDDQLVELDLYDRGINTFDLATAQFRDCDWCPIGATLFTVNPAQFLHKGYPNVFEDAGVSMQLAKLGKRLVNSPGSWVWHEHITYQKKADVDMHDKYLRDRYNPERMLISLKSFYRENGFIIHDEYIWRENGLYSLTREQLKQVLNTKEHA